MVNSSARSLLAAYKERVEKDILESSSYFGPACELHDACMYALKTGGKRFRPILVHMMGSSLNSTSSLVDAALAVEFFHTASLIADDLPSMDDDDMRRGTPATHKAFSESTALLASYALIAAGYEAIARGASKNTLLDDSVCRLALENATYNTGVMGATGGQFLDIDPPSLDEAMVRRIIHLKTVSLFEISFVFGWLFGGGDLLKLDLVKRAASCFGTAFQIADDIDDLEQDAKNERAVNMAALLGVDRAREIVRSELDQFYSLMESLGVDYREFKVLGEQLI